MLTRHSLQTLDEDLHVALAGRFIQIEIGASTAHLVATISERFIHMILGQGASILFIITRARNGRSAIDWDTRCERSSLRLWLQWFNVLNFTLLGLLLGDVLFDGIIKDGLNAK